LNKKKLYSLKITEKKIKKETVQEFQQRRRLLLLWDIWLLLMMMMSV
jgi:hypothetical protein